MSSVDRALREAMIATARRMNATGLNQGTSGNLSLRVDGGFLVTPTGMDYEALEPEDIVLNPSNSYVADFVAHMNPLGVLTAEDVAEPGTAEGDPVPRDMPVRAVMGLLAQRSALPVQGGGRITQAAVLARLIDTRG